MSPRRGTLTVERRAPRVRVRRRLARAAAEAIDAGPAPEPADRPSLDVLDTALAGLTAAAR